MKKLSLRIIFSIAVITTATTVLSLEFESQEAANAYFAQQRQQRQKIQETMQKGITNDMALREAINSISEIGLYEIEWVCDMRSLVQQTKIPHERVTKMLESMIREKLSAIEKNESDGVSWSTGELLPLFGAFPDYDPLPIIKECSLSKHESVRQNAIRNYVAIVGARSVPFLRGVIEKEDLNSDQRNQLFQLLETAIVRHEENVKIFKGSQILTNDVEKFNAFIKEMKQAKSKDVTEQKTE